MAQVHLRFLAPFYTGLSQLSVASFPHPFVLYRSFFSGVHVSPSTRISVPSMFLHSLYERMGRLRV